MPAPVILALNALDFGWIVLGLVIMFTALSVVVLSLVWLERKALGRLQRRLGPTRTGPMGLLQPVADAVKLILKEDIIPTSSEKAIFWGAPVVVVISAFMIWVTIPGTQNAVLKNLEMGLFYIIAFSVVGILGLVLAGWGSANKYGTLGGLRAAAQLISYEIPIIMVAVSVGMLAQSLDLREIVAQQGSYPFVLVQPLGLVIFFIAGLAEVGRTPFDIYFAESEIVGGPFVEYSGAHWSVFFLGRIHQHLRHRRAHRHPVLRRVGRTRPVGLLGNHLAARQSVSCGHGNLLDQGDLPPVEDRPADGLRLEGGRPPVVPQRGDDRNLPVLWLACLVADSDVSGWAGLRGLRDLPADDRAGKSRGRREGTAGGAAGPKTERPRRSEE